MYASPLTRLTNRLNSNDKPLSQLIREDRGRFAGQKAFAFYFFFLPHLFCIRLAGRESAALKRVCTVVLFFTGQRMKNSHQWRTREILVKN